MSSRYNPNPRARFARNLLSAAVIAGSSSVALAQVSTEEQQAIDSLEEIQVYGIRTSILDSVGAKRDADTIADIVDAGALSSLPDQSIADALGRVPGVTTVRDSGQSSQLNIRGMNGDYLQTTLNGREQATTSALTESSRWMSFDMYPAELITQAAVYKSPKASLIEGGVAATVDMKTINPLDQEKEHSVNLNARLAYNDLADETGADELGNRFTASYSGKFADDTIGVAVGYSHLEQTNTFIRAAATADGQLGYKPTPTDAGTLLMPEALTWQTGEGTDTRDTFVGVLAFQPTDNLTIKADYFTSEFDREDIRHSVITALAGGYDAQDAFSNVSAANQSFDYLIDQPHFAHGDPDAITASDGWIEARTEDQSTNAQSTAMGLNLVWDINEKATLSFDWSSSTGDKTRKDRIASMHAYDNYNDGDATWSELPNQGFSVAGNGDEIPTMVLNGGLDLASTDQMRLSRYEEYPHEYTDEVDSYRLDLRYELDTPFISSVEVGARQSERTFVSDRGTFQWGSRDGLFNNADGSWCEGNFTEDPSNPGNAAPGKTFVECSPQDISDFASVGSIKGAPDHLVLDINGLADSVFGPGNYNGIKTWGDEWTFLESSNLTEETTAIYLMANLDFQVGSIPVTGNIGVRQVETDVSSRGIQNARDGSGEPITDGLGVVNNNYVNTVSKASYSDTLPSLNLNFQLTDNDYVRFAAAKVMGRPPVGQMKGGAGSWLGQDCNDNWPGQVSDIGGCGAGDTVEYNVWTKGTPALDPFRADQFDLSYEHYFEDGGMVTAAVFYKDIKSIVAKTFVGGAAAGPLAEANGYSLPDVPDGEQYEFAWAAFESYLPADGGYIQGVELAITKTFSSLPGVFSGLGATATYSYNDSEIDIGGTGGSGDFVSGSDSIPIPGLSENIWSVTGFWDIGNFSTHLNVRYRDEYTLNRPVPGNTAPVIAQPYTTVDWQGSYSFDTGIDLVFQVNNLTDEANKQSFGVDGLLGEYNTYGRQFYMGVNYRY
ncbi:TonB-dependent receptor [Simiduia sp. 21SJ11W-1]|uniref:TonB-dependent receptor n=1 Tax=Simiduia sp. 21SJ11W-1 TaxID=2909669 RepID=UPI0020A1F365|nr:TonB-dependent receptor [Simiduia sp. 21SJ11W-1]UTA47724.1 TonB-dependent receptor [Simiduia sp. 21SJ11W-1]